MFERVSNKLVQSQKSNMREDEVAIYQYGYYLLFEVALNMSLGLICGILLHAVNMVFLFWIIYIPIRKYCGGWHASRDWVCTIISTIVLVIAILWSRYYIGLANFSESSFSYTVKSDMRGFYRRRSCISRFFKCLKKGAIGPLYG